MTEALNYDIRFECLANQDQSRIGAPGALHHIIVNGNNISRSKVKCLTAIIIALTCLTWSAHAKYNCSDIKPNKTSESHESQKSGLWREPISGMEFVKVFGGCFQMGQTREDKHQIINVRGKEKYLKYFSEE